MIMTTTSTQFHRPILFLRCKFDKIVESTSIWRLENEALWHALRAAEALSRILAEYGNPRGLQRNVFYQVTTLSIQEINYISRFVVESIYQASSVV